MSVSSAANILDLPASGTAGDVVVLDCYERVGDGGGGMFYCEATPDSAKLATATASTYTILDATNTNPIVIATSTPHGLTTGQSVLIEGVQGNTAANGSRQVVVRSATQFALLNSAGNGTYVAPTPPAVNTASAVTLTTTAAAKHGLETGDKIIIAGATGMTGINGLWTPVYVISDSSFSIPCSATRTYDPGTGSIGDGRMSFPASGGVRWVRHADAGVYNVRWFGAKGDGSVDDLPAFQAALDVIATDTRRAVQNRGGIIQVPPGVYLLNGNLLIQDTVILQGVAADYFQLHSAGELRFAAGCGIVVMGSREATGHRGDATKIQDLTVYGKKLTIARNGEELPVPLWQYASDYVVGDIVVLPHDHTFVYECVAGGKSASRPAPAWLKNHSYSPGERVTPTQANGHSYVCKTPTASGTGTAVTQAGTTATLTGMSGISSLMEGGTIVVSGFATAANNGTFVVTSSTTTSVTYTNAAAGAVTEAGLASWAIGAGAASGDAEPTWLWEPADIVSDGTVKWQREDDSVYLLELLGRTPMRYGVSATDPSVYWTPLHTYRNGDVIRARGITSCLFLNVTGTVATSGGSEPPWKTGLDDITPADGGITWRAIDPSESLIQDNTVTWAVRCHAGIMADCLIYVDTVSLSEFTGAGVHMRGSGASLPISNINFWRLQNVSVLYCNGGIFVAGYDDNGGYATGCTVYGTGADGHKDEKDYGIWDDGFTGATWVGCRIEWVAGTPFRATQPVGTSVFVGCYDEAVCKPRITRGVVIGGTLGHGGHADAFTADTTAPVFSQSGHFNQMATDWKAKGISNGPLYTFLGGNVQSQFKNTILGALPSGPEVAPSGILWTHDTPQCPDGWFLWSYNPDAYGASRGAFACSAGSAVPFRSDFLNGGQPGQFWIPRGEFFVGGSLFSTKTTCVRYHTAPPTDGTWVVGDIVFNTDPSSNGVLAWQCTAADTPETWTPIHLDRVKTMALANDFTTTNDTATSTNLTFAVGANDLWFVEVTGCISSGDVNGIRVAFSAPTGATVAGNAFGHNTSTTEYVDNPLTTTSLSPAFVTLANNPQLFSASATIMMDGTHTGSITFQAASVMLGQTCTIKAGACMRATRVDAV